MNFQVIKEKTIKGWNTWNTASVLSHVLLPQGFAINIGIKDYGSSSTVRESLIGRFGEHEEHIHPGMRSYDGSYTELTISLGDTKFFVQSAAKDNEQYVLITPLQIGIKPPTVFVETAILWNGEGYTYKDGEKLCGKIKDTQIDVYVTGKRIFEPHTHSTNPYITVELSHEVGVSTSKEFTTSQIKQIIAEAKEKLNQSTSKYGELSETYNAMRSCLAWDTIFEPENKQICSPVSRLWNMHWGGYVLFCWDTFFAAAMIAIENKDFAYSNVFAILNEITENGFVPNFGAANDDKSRDRSQPPVGSMVVWNIYKQYGEKWFLQECFDRLSVWNKWFYENRMYEDGTLCWGSDPFEPKLGKRWETDGVYDRFGAALESGLDNSPMYDDIEFNKATHMLELSDVGLTGLFINDCNNLINIAKEIGADYSEFEKRLCKAKAGLKTLWCEEYGFFLNKRTDTGEFSYRISPTNFYAMYSDDVTSEQANRCINEHFYNPDEFWGEFIIPSIARNDKAYPDQDYWRGRIWAPMNYLAYEALRAAKLDNACNDLAEKSNNLLLKEWNLHGHVHENYSGDTGMGCGVHNSDKFYHWGGLLGYIALIQKGMAK